MMRTFFKLNLLGPWSDANKRGLGLVMARDLARNKTKAFDRLPPATRRILGLYGIDEPRWDIARQAVRKAADGREYLMPDMLDDMPDEAFDPSPRKARRLRDEIETSLRAYYVDRADFGVPTPGARERAILTQGTEPGTGKGEAIRFIAQFKAFPVTVLTKPFGRELFGHGAGNFRDALFKGQGDILGLTHMMISTTILGYLALSAKELAKGKTPRDPLSAETWAAAMMQGGGAGIYGDFIFGEYNRFGRSLLDTLAGPTLGSVSDMAELWARFRSGEDVGASSFRFILGNAPFMNLFYTRIAFDYLFFYQVQEAMNPGYLRRMERRVQRENAQSFILPPSEAIR